MLRFAICVVVAAALGGLLWLRRPTELSRHTNIVGYPTFYNFDFAKMILAYRLAVWELPLVAFAVYALLRWRGPLRNRAATRRGPVELIDPFPAEELASDAGPRLTRLVQVIPPAAVVAFAVSTRPASVAVHISKTGIAAGVAYVVVVLALAALVSFAGSRRDGSRLALDPISALSLVNGFAGALAAVGGLAYVSRHTLVMSTAGERRYWNWFPLWLAAVLLIAVLAWMMWRLTSGWSPTKVESRVRIVLVGCVAIYLLTAAIPGATTQFLGFDDGQSVTGADLLTRGYFPWRDFLFIHGLFQDALLSNIGFGAFQHSLWGATAGIALIVGPLCWVAYYLLGAWAGRRGSLIVLGIFGIIAWGGIPLTTRFIVVPVVFVLLGEAIRRPRPVWMVLFTVVLFIEAVLTPEASFQVIAAAIAIIGCDLVHRGVDVGWWGALRRTRWFVGTGIVLCVAWGIFLELNHALGAFIDYFRIFGPGHNAAGAIPQSLEMERAPKVMFALTAALVVLTIWMVAWRLFGRHSWTARDWVMVAAAIMAGLYGEKALGRIYDIYESISIGLPLWILWAGALLGPADDFVTAQLRRVRSLRPTMRILRQPIALLLILLAVLTVPQISRTIYHAPAKTHKVVPSLADVPLLGYDLPSTLDPTLLPDLRTALDTYAGPNGEIFDSTNSLGYFYYLLQRKPATSFVHISMAEPEYAQNLLIGQLKKSKPKVVVFDESIFGLAGWDGIRNNVRHFDVAQYLLDGWTPVLRTHTVLFMVRNDLLSSLPAVPTLSTPPQTTDLYNSSQTCAWGDVPNFLDSHPTGQSLSLTVTPQGQRQNLDVQGWAFDTKTNTSPSRIVVTLGDKVVAVTTPSVSRPDLVTAVSPAAATSGYSVTVSTSPAPGKVGVFALGSDGTLHPTDGTAAPASGSLTMPDGTSLPVTAPISGYIDLSTSTTSALMSVTVPAGTRLSDYALATLSAPGPIGTASLDLTDGVAQTPTDPLNYVGHDISANVLPLSGSSIGVRVGSCLQWHGYSTQTLYLSQSGGTPITGIRLSGVKD